MLGLHGRHDDTDKQVEHGKRRRHDERDEEGPRFIIVEPEQANCLQKSAQAGKPVVVTGDLETLMAGLACGEVSSLAWTILQNGADDFMTLSEEAIPQAMRMLASGEYTKVAIEGGESAVPGFAAAIIAKKEPKFAEKLNLTENSRVLVIGTEGATDADLYRQIIDNKI